MPSYTMSFSCVKIKRASLERDFYTALFVYNGINLHTVRHKSVLHNIYPSQSHNPTTKQPSLPRLVQTYLINRGHHALHHPTQNAMPQAIIRPETDPSKKKKSAVQCAVGGCVVSLGVCPNIHMSCES